jgi:hypothetical protein
MTDRLSMEFYMSLQQDAGRWIFPKSMVQNPQYMTRLKDWEKVRSMEEDDGRNHFHQDIFRATLSLDKVAIDSTDVAAKKGEKR